jgi:hypothetical protein
LISIKISVSSEYEVKVGRGLLCHLGKESAAVVAGRNAVIVSDSNVWPLYGKLATESLAEAGFSVLSWIISAGESSKNSENYIKLLTFLAENRITRADCLVALGGGVVGDLTGLPRQHICGVSPTSRCPRLFWPWWIPPLVARPPSICPQARIWQAHSISRALCFVTPTRWKPYQNENSPAAALRSSNTAFCMMRPFSPIWRKMGEILTEIA